MKDKSKLFGLLAIITMLVPMFVGGIVGGAATDGNVDITLHKKEFTTLPEEPIKNDGEVMNQFANVPGLNDVTFEAYNITDIVYSWITRTADSLTAEEAVKKVVEISTKIQNGEGPVTEEGTSFSTFANFGSLADTKTTATVGGEKGIAKFANLPGKTNGKDSVFLFVETAQPKNVVGRAAPMVVSLPLLGEDEEPLTDIHIYPKNLIADAEKGLDGIIDGTTVKDLPTLTVDGVEHKNVAVGNLLQYHIDVPIPDKIGKVTHFFVNDIPTNGFKFEEVKSIKVGDENYNSEKYTITADKKGVITNNTYGAVDNKNGFMVKFDIAEAKKYVGKTVRITYTMTVAKEIVPDDPATNDATINFDSEVHDLEGPDGYTGGYHFVKIDKNSEKTLEGVGFKVEAPDGKFVNFTQDATSKEWVFNGFAASKDAATEITSGAGGKLTIRGLLKGAYKLHETTAKEDYVPLTAPVNFTISHGTYKDLEENGSPTHQKTVENIKKGILPSTGGTGIIAFLAVGVALMAGAFIWYRKSKVNEEV
ncbi:SpaH/EbpB family LPXTG-anchored major pilin [Enterococcus canintestini]|uniref:SpaH/EbpB family LPXTG-anchored major pilin n=1 Tax=Enterococcus canintestini TaxID=317010 RepID=UPI002891EB24|nr:SpaH/EbpB family LPXTG-anchored major pilin [Enterococcus canintestini]MDT2740739.1 SpaH/EbpB family LPXTG-anchored major pilin [Enterococcus canintestini]